MAQSAVERRRAPRVHPKRAQTLSLDVSLSVQVVDISLSGILLASKSEMMVGDQAQLRATIGSRMVSVGIEIRRVTLDPNAGRSGLRYRAGAVFSPMSAEQRVDLEQLLGAERS